MSLIRHSNRDVDWPDWLASSRFFSLPDTWKGFMEDVELKVEEFTEEGQLVVRAEMPGLDPDKDVEISMSDHMLHLRAERRSETKTEDKKGYRSEFRYGSFSRSVPLPAGATDEDVKATYTDGVLEVRIPIDASEAEGKKIPVQRG